MRCEFEKMLKFGEPQISLADRLRKEELPLILWGVGDVGADVKRYLVENEISITAAWVDGVDKGEYFDGIPVYSLEDLKSMYDAFNVILGHSHYELGSRVKQKEACIKEVFYLINTSYTQYKGADFNFIRKHIDEYYNIYTMLGDDMSRRCMTAYLNCKMNEDINFMTEFVKGEQNFFNNDIFKIGDQETYVDVGAYDGDTLKLFLKECCGAYKMIYALEPEDESFAKLQKYVEDNKVENVNLIKKGTWNKESFLACGSGEQQRFSIKDGNNGETRIELDTLDHILQQQTVTLIKINFYEGVYETLQGGCETLKRCTPKLAISVGFDEKEILRITELIKSQAADYRIYLRFNSCIPARLIMYAQK